MQLTQSFKMPNQELCRSSFLWQWHLSSDWCVLGGRNVDGYSSVHRTWSWRGRAGGVDVGIQAGVVDVVDVNVEALDQQNVAGAWTLSWHSRLLCSRVHQPGVQVGGSGDEPSYDDVDIDNLPFFHFFCRFDCYTGPDINSICTADGTWSPYPTCEVRTCRSAWTGLVLAI